MSKSQSKEIPKSTPHQYEPYCKMVEHNTSKESRKDGTPPLHQCIHMLCIFSLLLERNKQLACVCQSDSPSQFLGKAPYSSRLYFFINSLYLGTHFSLQYPEVAKVLVIVEDLIRKEAVVNGYLFGCHHQHNLNFFHFFFYFLVHD